MIDVVDVLVAGAHGQIARRLTPLVVRRGHTVRGLVRDPDHLDDVAADGARSVLCDLENATDDDVDAAVDGVEAIVFAAGAGPGSGAARKETMDLGGALRLIDAAERHAVRRFVMVSSMGTDDPPQDDEVFSVYLRAKARADDVLRSSGLDHTVVRPTRLTDDEPTGRVTIGRPLPRGEIPRADVAAVLAAVLEDPGTIGRTFDVVSGDTPIPEAVIAVPTRVAPDPAAPSG